MLVAAIVVAVVLLVLALDWARDRRTARDLGDGSRHRRWAGLGQRSERQHQHQVQTRPQSRHDGGRY